MLENIPAQTAALCIPRLDRRLEGGCLKFAPSSGRRRPRMKHRPERNTTAFISFSGSGYQGAVRAARNTLILIPAERYHVSRIIQSYRRGTYYDVEA